MKKLNDIDIFVKMLEKSEETFRTVPAGNETYVTFSERKIIFIFNEQGGFLRITSLK